ncbi:hypothetical protein B0H16DRAFT_1696658 [Mycena metata]|uniref:Uncharacterized protein n=1 Tax=Mycena metata TaxID=1033252 RepID=A0AAD7MTP7_9AGAR|nr:hypothetical protein B0H16DRAFT_1696658 [Mycena metata]
MYSDDNDNDETRRDSSLERELQEYNTDKHRDEESQYNDGKGIICIVTLKPTLPPAPVGTKRRSNARADPVRCPFEVQNCCWDPTHIIIYRKIMEEVVRKGKPDVKLEIIESADNCAHLTAPAAEGDAPELDSRKGKKRQLPPEEEEIAETIIQLNTAHHCSDRSCTSRVCFVGNPSATHIRLTPLHLETWAAAILAKSPNVDVQTPPGPDVEKMFWPPTDAATADDVDDIGTLASRRKSLLSKSAPTSSVTVNNDFSAFASILRPFLPGSTSAPSISTPHRTPTRTAPRPSLSASPLKPTPMTIAEFCTAFKLSAEIADGLAPMELEGPHLLEFLENSLLDKYLKIGQRITLRYAESQWQKGMVSA